MTLLTQKISRSLKDERCNDDGYVYKLITTVDGINETYFLQKGTYNIGRDDECDIQLLQSTVSRNHAQIIVEGGGVAFVTDHRSSNDTFRNGIKLHKNVIYELISDNELIFGDVVCKYILESEKIENNHLVIVNKYESVFSEPYDDDIIPDTQEENDIISVDPETIPNNSDVEDNQTLLSKDVGYNMKSNGVLRPIDSSSSHKHDDFVALSNDSDIFKDLEESDMSNCSQNTHNNLEVTVSLDKSKTLSPFQDSFDDMSNISLDKELRISKNTIVIEEDNLCVVDSRDIFINTQNEDIQQICESNILDPSSSHNSSETSQKSLMNGVTESANGNGLLETTGLHELIRHSAESVTSVNCVQECQEHVCHDNSPNFEKLPTLEDVAVHDSPQIPKDCPKDTEIAPSSNGERVTEGGDQNLHNFFTCSDKESDVKLSDVIMDDDDHWMNFSEENTLAPPTENTGSNTSFTPAKIEAKQHCQAMTPDFEENKVVTVIHLKKEETIKRAADVTDIDENVLHLRHPVTEDERAVFGGLPIIVGGLKKSEESDFIDRLNDDVNEDETLTQRLTDSCYFDHVSSSQDSIYEQRTQKIDDLIAGTQIVLDDHPYSERDCDTQTPTQIISSNNVANKSLFSVDDDSQSDVIEATKDTHTPTKMLREIAVNNTSLGSLNVSSREEQGDLNTTIRGRVSLSLKKALTKDTKIIFPDRTVKDVEEHKFTKEIMDKDRAGAIDNIENQIPVKEGTLREENSRKRRCESIRTTLARSVTKGRVKKLINVDEVNRQMFDMDDTAVGASIPQEGRRTILERQYKTLPDVKRKNSKDDRGTLPPPQKRLRSADERNMPGSSTGIKERGKMQMAPKTSKRSKAGKKAHLCDRKVKVKRTAKATVKDDLNITERTRQGRRSSSRMVSDSSVVIPRTCQNVIMFCGSVDKRYDDAVKRLGGVVTDDASLATHFVMNKMRRTVKFLCCVTRGVYIVTSEWLDACQRLRSFIPTNSYVLTNGCNEYNVDLQMVLQLSRRAQTLCNGILGHYKYVVFVTENTKPGPKDLSQIISLSGGKCVLISDDHFTDYINEANVRHICIADEWSVKNVVHPNIVEIMARDIDIVSVEFLFDMVLEQKHPTIKNYKMISNT